MQKERENSEGPERGDFPQDFKNFENDPRSLRSLSSFSESFEIDLVYEEQGSSSMPHKESTTNFNGGRAQDFLHTTL